MQRIGKPANKEKFAATHRRPAPARMSTFSFSSEFRTVNFSGKSSEGKLTSYSKPLFRLKYPFSGRLLTTRESERESPLPCSCSSSIFSMVASPPPPATHSSSASKNTPYFYHFCQFIKREFEVFLVAGCCCLLCLCKVCLSERERKRENLQLWVDLGRNFIVRGSKN